MRPSQADFPAHVYLERRAIDSFKGNGAVITSQIPKSEFDQLAHLQVDGADDEYFNTVTENLNGRANPSGYDVTSGPVVKNPSAVRRGDVPEPSSTQSQTVLHTDDATQLFEKYIQNDYRI